MNWPGVAGRKAYSNRAKFVISRSNEADIANPEIFPALAADQILIYPDTANTVEFARALATSLLTN